MSFKKSVFRLIGSSMYLSGLSLLIPLSIIAVFSFGALKSFPLAVVIIILLTIFGAWLVRLGCSSRSEWFWNLSISTCVPVLLSIVFEFVDASLIFSLLNYFPNSGFIFPLIDIYLKRVPHGLILTFLYSILGVFFYFLSKR